MIVFLVNRTDELQPHQTTTRLVESCLHAGQRVAVTDIFSIDVLGAADIRALAAVLPASSEAPASVAEATRCAPRVEVSLADQSLVVVRTSPGRDLTNSWAHQLALQAVRMVRDAGVPVVNDPIGLQRASSKLYSTLLPEEMTPRTLVTHNWESARSFIEALGGPAVIKPLLGSGGRDVFFVDDLRSDNLQQLCDLLGRTGYLMVQEFLPGAAKGDLRVLVLDGEVLAVEGREAVVHRVPRLGEFRSNVSLGAAVRPGALTDEQRRRCQVIARQIAEDGIRFAGLDLVGELVVEVNVFSTGGLVDIEKFHNRDFAHVVMTRLLEPSCHPTPRPPPLAAEGES